MKVALFLHAYQPTTQFPEITKKITEESYKRVIDLLVSEPRGRITLNVGGSLVEQLEEQKEFDLLSQIGYLSQQGQVELVGTAAYHPLLTTLPTSEIIRQNELNNSILSRHYPNFSPAGFFLPEMVFQPHVGKIIEEMGYQWIVLDESAHPQYESISRQESSEAELAHFKTEIGQKYYHFGGTNLQVFFRDTSLALAIAYAKIDDADVFVERLKRHREVGGEQYAVLAMDFETFGHHHKNNIGFLRDLINHDYIEMVTISELSQLGHSHEDIDPVYSTWGIIVEDDDGERVFPRWMDPENEVQNDLWQLYRMAVKYRSHKPGLVIDWFDRAVNSDTFWWASHSPCWHPGMLETGIDFLVKAIDESTLASDDNKNEARELGKRVLADGIAKYGSEILNC